VKSDSIFSASVVVCESVLAEESGLLTAVRILDTITIGAGSNTVHFFSITILHSKPLDFFKHKLRVTMDKFRNGNWETVAAAPDLEFAFGHKLSLAAPGGVTLRTEFNVDINTLGELGTFFVQAWLDGVRVASTPLTLRQQPH